MNIHSQLICVWSAMIFAVASLAGFVLADFIPPMSPNLGADEIATIYQENTLSLRFSVLLIMTSGAFMLPFVAAIAMQMKRIEGGTGPLTITQISGGTLAGMIFIAASVFWTAAAFRPDGDPNIVRAMNDLGWVMILMTFGPFIIQNFSLGLCVLKDKSETPVLPRWVGFYNFWTGVLFIPGGMLTFFKTGPFAWDGLFVWWIPFAFFFSWYVVMFFVMLRAVKQEGAALAT